jgi:pimeloyl-ACP methyl ester carboxylesterase
MRFRPALCALVVLGSCGLPAVFAPALQAADKASATAKAKGGKDTEIPEAEDVEMTTRDGIKMVATYWASTGKTPDGADRKKDDIVPVILLHAWKGSRTDFASLGPMLQAQGHSVIAPDLRGHGDSKVALTADGSTAKLDAGSLKPGDFAAMADHGNEVEQCKKFLLKRNNEGQLNIEKLCVVGVEMGASVGLNWAALDWSWPVLSTLKQGQDVKALVLVSPEWTFKGLPINRAVQMPAIQSNLSILIIAGRNNAKGMEQARRLHKHFERFHPLPPAEEAKEKQDLFLDTPKTSLQGTKLLNEKTANLEQHIAQFIEVRLVNQRYPWAERKNPLSN